MGKSENRQRTENILLRVLPTENDYIKTNAKNAGFYKPDGEVNRQQYILSCVMGKNINPPLIDRNGAIQIAEQLRRIGANLNQLTRNVHLGYIDDCSKELKDLHKEIEKIYEVLTKSQ